MSDMARRFSSRKFWITLIVIAVTTGITLAGKLTGDFATVMTVCIGSYNIVNGYVEGKKA